MAFITGEGCSTSETCVFHGRCADANTARPFLTEEDAKSGLLAAEMHGLNCTHREMLAVRTEATTILRKIAAEKNKQD